MVSADLDAAQLPICRTLMVAGPGPNAASSALAIVTRGKFVSR
jgi:hypothetical protein